jgi:hypothetical protein
VSGCTITGSSGNTGDTADGSWYWDQSNFPAQAPVGPIQGGYVGGNIIINAPLIEKEGIATVFGDYFGPKIHALLVVKSEKTQMVPFMDRFHMIWLLDNGKWVAYDRNVFYNFIESEEQTVFYAEPLPKEQVLLNLHKPEDENS